MLIAKNETDWAQKYRPQRLEDIVLPRPNKEMLINLRDKKEGLSLFLHGAAGTGKTTVANLINPENTNKFNCSLNNGINLIRGIVSEFSSHSLIGDGQPRVILLDEADYLSEEAQAGLRGAIEMLSKTNMFVLTANFPERILDSLHSRLYSIDFSQLRGNTKLQKEMLSRAYEILKNEGVQEPDESAVEEIVRKHFPDMRKVLKELQGKFGFSRVDQMIQL